MCCSDGRPEPIGEHKIRISRYCRAVDTLIFKGRVELEELVKNFKQRHHVLTDYVYGPGKLPVK